MKFCKLFITAIVLGLSLLSLTQCESGKADSKVKLYDLESFMKRYNKEIGFWLDERIEGIRSQGQQLDGKLSDLVGSDDFLSEDKQKEKRKLERSIAAQQRELAKFEFRKSLGDFLSYGDVNDLPSDLVWENGMDEPEIGDSRA